MKPSTGGDGEVAIVDLAVDQLELGLDAGEHLRPAAPVRSDRALLQLEVGDQPSEPQHRRR